MAVGLSSPLSSGASILVHGSRELPVAWTAVGLARKAGPTFAWADCAGGRSHEVAEARSWIEARFGPPALDPVEAAWLRPADRDRLNLKRVVAAGGETDQRRLLNHLALPELFQRLTARAIEPDGRGVIVLLHVDALADAVRANTLDTAWLHETLHEEGITLVATARDRAADPLVNAFDQVLRYERASRPTEPDGTLTQEKPLGAGMEPSATGLRAVWQRLGLDPRCSEAPDGLERPAQGPQPRRRSPLPAQARAPGPVVPETSLPCARYSLCLREERCHG